MSALAAEGLGIAAAGLRLSRLYPLDDAAHMALAHSARRTRRIGPNNEIQVEGKRIAETLLVLSGWCARVRQLADGRRQVLSFLLPGELIGLCDQDEPLASSTIVALTPVDLCVAPERGVHADLDRAYSISRAQDEALLMAQITRLGRMNAYERVLDLLLELHERLELAGLATGGRFLVPVTQEILGDALGLTSVHINRTLQTIRSERVLSWKGREVALRDPLALNALVGRVSPRVTARCAPVGSVPQ